MVARSSWMPLCAASRSKPRFMQESMPSARQSTFMKLQGVDVVLVPLDDLAILHRRRLDRHQLVEPVVGEHEAARDAATRCRGAPISSRASSSARRRRRSSRLRLSSSTCLGSTPSRAPAPDLGREQLDQIFGQAQRLADIAQCALGAVADHRRAQGGMIAAVGVEHPLHDDLAPLVLEIDIDVGRLAPLLADEALEQQVIAVGIDRGDAEHVADRGIGGRAAALAQDVLRCGRSGRWRSRSGNRARSRASRSAAAHARGARRTLSGTPSG